MYCYRFTLCLVPLLLISIYLFQRLAKDDRGGDQWHQDWQHVMPSLSLKILAYSRPTALSSLLESIKNAYYPKTFQNMPLEIYIDGLPRITDSMLHQQHLRVCHVAKTFIWPFGPKRVKIHKKHYGVLGQYLNAWKKQDDCIEMALFLEDDVILSRFYFQYLYALFKSYGKLEIFHHNYYGISLQQPRTQLLKDENGTFKRIHRLPIDPESYLAGASASESAESVNFGFSTIYSFPKVSTWGQLYFRPAWRQFLAWYHTANPASMHPPSLSTIGQDFIFTQWLKEKKHRVWTPYFMQWVILTGAQNIYFLFTESEHSPEDDVDDDGGHSSTLTRSSSLLGSLAVSTQEKGNNYKEDVGPDAHLIDDPFPFIVPAQLQDMPSFDFCLRPVPRHQLHSNWFHQHNCSIY
jgi:hypothetical protein